MENLRCLGKIHKASSLSRGCKCFRSDTYCIFSIAFGAVHQTDRQTDQQADVTLSAPSAVILHVWSRTATTVYIDMYRRTWSECQQHQGLLLHLHLSSPPFLQPPAMFDWQPTSGGDREGGGWEGGWARGKDGRRGGKSKSAKWNQTKWTGWDRRVVGYRRRRRDWFTRRQQDSRNDTTQLLKSHLRSEEIPATLW